LRNLDVLFRAGAHSGLSDAQLLERFATRNGEAAELAFAMLVERHGPMVFRVCRCVLRDHSDAEDAFQATFLVLVRNAQAIRKHDSVASWLHGAALRVASCSRAASARRRRHEQRAAEGESSTPRDDDRNDVEAAVHEEVGRLPERFRVPVVLCYLEGVTQEEAAARLGWPLGTVRSRLARARDRLRGRLARRGLAPAATGVAAILADGSAEAAVPVALADATVRIALKWSMGGASAAGVVPATVLALSGEALRSLFMFKLKSTVAATIAATALAGAAVLAQQGNGPVPSANNAGPSANPGANPSAPANAVDVERLAARQSLDELKATIDRQRAELLKTLELMDKARADLDRREVAGNTPQPQVADPRGQATEPVAYGELLQATTVPSNGPLSDDAILRKFLDSRFPNLRVTTVRAVKVAAEPCKNYPLVGNCQLVSTHYKCTLAWDEPSTIKGQVAPHHESFELDASHLVRCTDTTHAHAGSSSGAADGSAAEVEAVDRVRWANQMVARGYLSPQQRDLELRRLEAVRNKSGSGMTGEGVKSPSRSSSAQSNGQQGQSQGQAGNNQSANSSGSTKGPLGDAVKVGSNVPNSQQSNSNGQAGNPNGEKPVNVPNQNSSAVESSEQDRRLREVERKLDQILKALGHGQPGEGNPARR
jgi:RNA polymerase sigma factor (sigma-70 family)